jgi:hypothetical protein
VSWALVGIGSLGGLALGAVLGRKSMARRDAFPDSMDIRRLSERMIHARNVEMRLHELGVQQRTLWTTQNHNLELQGLRREVEWMLDLVQVRLHEAQTPLEWEAMETLLSAVSKSLRHMLEVGQFPEMDCGDFLPVETQIRNTLHLLTQPSTPPLQTTNSETQQTDNKINGVACINLLIHQFREIVETASWSETTC